MLCDGLPIAHLTRGGKTLTTFIDALPDGIETTDVYARLLSALVELIAAGHMSPLVIEKCNGTPIHHTPAANILRSLGAGITPKGVRIVGRAAPPRVPRHGAKDGSPEDFRGDSRGGLRGGRRASEAIEELSFDDPPPPPPPRNSGGFRPRGGYRR
ncbi:hypothetical protein HMPREF0277_0003 [Corynebacterium accolens ATCC 49726]|nr:hypothetical protein HMPREF0277_0003 [Corynebacterium accolens ATCC 49726]